MPSPSRNRRSCIAITSVPRSFWGYIVYRCKHSACYWRQKYVVFFFFDFFGWIGATVSTQKRCFRHLCLERPQETCKIRRGSIGSINLSPIDGKIMGKDGKNWKIMGKSTIDQGLVRWEHHWTVSGGSRKPCLRTLEGISKGMYLPEWMELMAGWLDGLFELCQLCHVIPRWFAWKMIGWYLDANLPIAPSYLGWFIVL